MYTSHLVSFCLSMETYTHKPYLQSSEMWGNYFLEDISPFSISGRALYYDLKFFITKFIGFMSFLKDFRQDGGRHNNIIIFHSRTKLNLMHI